jgi:hypothetical protein
MIEVEEELVAVANHPQFRAASLEAGTGMA